MHVMDPVLVCRTRVSQRQNIRLVGYHDTCRLSTCLDLCVEILRSCGLGDVVVEFTGFILLCLTIIIATVEVVRYRRGVRFDFLFFFSLWYAASYSLAPFAMSLGGAKFANWAFHAKYHSSESLMTAAMIYLGYLMIVLGYYSPIRSRKQTANRFRWRLSRSVTILLVVGMLVVGIGAFLVFVSRYGGIQFVQANVSDIRSATIERDNIGAISGLFAKNVYLVTWLVLIYVIEQNRNRMPVSVGTLAVCAALLAMSFYYGLIRGSRGGLINTFLVPSLAYCVANRRMPSWKWILLISAMGTMIILFGKSVILQVFYLGPGQLMEALKSAFSARSFGDNLSSFVANYTHPYLSLRQAIDYAGTDRARLRFFADWPLGILYFGRLFDLEVPHTVTYLNTYLALGRWQSNIPPGLIGSFWYQLQSAGVIMGSFFYGWCGRRVNDFLVGACVHPVGVLVYTFSALSYGEFIFTGDPNVWIIQRFEFLCFRLFALSLGFRIVRRSGYSPGIDRPVLGESGSGEAPV